MQFIKFKPRERERERDREREGEGGHFMNIIEKSV
jgi:hypothetical protein